MDRRSFLSGIIAAATAPAFIRASMLMPVKQLDSGIIVLSFNAKGGQLSNPGELIKHYLTNEQYGLGVPLVKINDVLFYDLNEPVIVT